MEVILREDIDKVGSRGQVVKVAPGYARNFPVSAIPVQNLSHLFYAFAGLAEDATVIEADPVMDSQRIFGPEPPGLDYHGHFAQLDSDRRPQS